MLAKDHPERKIDKDYYNFSGTSMSAAEVSGVVALMLARNPGLTPNQVKYRRDRIGQAGALSRRRPGL